MIKISALSLLLLFIVPTIFAKSPFHNPTTQKPDLKGISICGKRKCASLEIEENGKRKCQSVSEGDSIGNWKLTKVENTNRVKVQNALTGAESTLTL